uniref:Uncharacterized protein n=1 Tax=Eutreptiella gymnastica TaxID=73025 RepID=A0A7S1NP66_9EUGL
MWVQRNAFGGPNRGDIFTRVADTVAMATAEEAERSGPNLVDTAQIADRVRETLLEAAPGEEGPTDGQLVARAVQSLSATQRRSLQQMVGRTIDRLASLWAQRLEPVVADLGIDVELAPKPERFGSF